MNMLRGQKLRVSVNPHLCKTQTADCRLQTRSKMVKYRLRVKCAVPENSNTMEGFLAFTHHPSRNSSLASVLLKPPPPWNFHYQ